MSATESFIPVNGSAGNSAPVGGRRHKLRLVTKKVARKHLKKLGMKLRGGAPNDAVAVDAATGAPAGPVKMGGKRTRKHRRSASRKASFFGL